MPVLEATRLTFTGILQCSARPRWRGMLGAKAVNLLAFCAGMLSWLRMSSRSMPPSPSGVEVPRTIPGSLQGIIVYQMSTLCQLSSPTMA